MNGPSSPRFVLRDLGVATRLVLAVFLVSVGVGYFSALWQLHVQAASPGKLLPDAQDAVRIYHGAPVARPMSKVEQLLEAEPTRPFNGSGSMQPAFTTKSSGWKKEIKQRAHETARRGAPNKAQLDKAEQELRAEREGERQAVLAWIRNGAKKADYERDDFCVPEDQRGLPITPEYLVTKDDKPVSPRAVKVRSILTDRCARCHAPDTSDKAHDFPLDTYEHLRQYVVAKPAGSSGRMSPQKLAQTTHVHLLGFAMLYGLTGLIFSFTSYPTAVRLVVAPLPLAVQLVDIGCWWLAQLDPVYAQLIPVTGGIVALGLFLHIVLSLFNMFGPTGKAVVVALLLAAAAGGYQLKQGVIDPALQQEVQPQQQAEE
jgi:hypothetical protein